MKRIGIDCRLWNETGVGRYIRNLVCELDKLKPEFEFVLFALSKDKEEIGLKIKDLRFKIVEANIRWHSFKEQIEFPQVLNKANLDLMHFPYFAIPIAYNKPYIITIHDLILHHFPTGKASTLPGFLYSLKLQAYKFIMQYSALRSKKIIAVSNSTKKEIIDHLHVSSNKITVTYEGVDTGLVNNKNSKHSALSSLPYFLYVGNAYPHKNLEQLLVAFSEFKTEIATARHGKLRNDTKLILVGKKDFFYSRIEERVKDLGLQNSVVFKHDVNDEEIGSLYKHALATICPSLMEGFGLPALEAMANSCLVIASNIAAFQEVCQDCAVYFNPFDISDLSKKLSSVYNKQIDITEKKKKGLERVKIFSWEKMAKETLSIYEGCTGV